MRRAASSVLDHREVARLLDSGTATAHPELEEAVGLLRSVASGQAPRPTPALAELLDRGFEPCPVPVTPAAGGPGRHAGRRLRRLGAVVTAGLASVLLAGTAQALPGAVQNGLADLVAALTPFEFPRSTPAQPGPVAPRPSTGPDLPFLGPDLPGSERSAPLEAPHPSPAGAPPAGTSATRSESRRGPAPSPADRPVMERERAAEDDDAARDAAEESEDARHDDAKDDADEAEDARDDSADEVKDAADEAEDAADEVEDAADEADDPDSAEEAAQETADDR